MNTIRADYNWGDAVIIIADEGKGLVEVQFNREYYWNGYICDLIVSPEARRQGIAGKLLQEAEKVVANEGKTIARLKVEKRYDWLVKWYERKGYKIEEDNENDDEAFMYKILR